MLPFLLDIFLFLLIIFLFLAFYTGLILLAIGILIGLLKRKIPTLTKIGLIMTVIPGGLYALMMLYSFLFNSFASKLPEQNDLAGVYKVTEVVRQRDLLGIRYRIPEPAKDFEKYRLELKSDSTYTLTPLIPHNVMCNNGKYQVNYKLNYYNFSSQCPNTMKWLALGNIDRRWSGYKIGFWIINGETIYFEKTNE